MGIGTCARLTEMQTLWPHHGSAESECASSKDRQATHTHTEAWGLVLVLKAWHSDDLHEHHPGPVGNANVQVPPRTTESGTPVVGPPCWVLRWFQYKKKCWNHESREALEAADIHTRRLCEGPLKWQPSTDHHLLEVLHLLEVELLWVSPCASCYPKVPGLNKTMLLPKDDQGKWAYWICLELCLLSVSCNKLGVKSPPKFESLSCIPLPAELCTFRTQSYTWDWYKRIAAHRQYHSSKDGPDEPLSAGQPWRHRHREQTCGHPAGRSVWANWE